MRNLLKPTTRAKAKMAKTRMNWSWNAWSQARRKKKMQRQLLKTMQKSPWTGVAGGLFAGAAGLLAFFALQSASEKRKAGKLAAGPTHGRSLFQLSTGTATPRFERNRSFGWF